MRRFAAIGVALSLGVLALAPEAFAGSARVAALQVALRAHGFDPGPVDGVRGQLTGNALVRFQRARGLAPDGKLGPATRRALGKRGRPFLGRRTLSVGALGWDVAVLEFRLRAERAPAPRRGRAVHGANDGGAPALPATAGARSRRDRRTKHLPSAVPTGARPLPHRQSRRELLLHRRALQRQSRGSSPAGTACRSHASSFPVNALRSRRARERSRRRPGPRPATRFGRRSTTGLGSTASIPRSPERSPGWSPASSRTSCRASARSA